MRKRPRYRWARAAGRPSGTSPCPTSNGDCCTACSSATHARWASSEQYRWCLATSAASPIPCRCTLKCSITNTTSSPLSPSPLCWRCWRWKPWLPRPSSKYAPKIRAAPRIERETVMSIAIRNVSKRFGQFNALHDISLDIPTGELVALLGPSGCGKTTLLRIIAGMELPDSGTIAFHGEDTTEKHTRERQVGFVFQHYALFRHMSAFDNVAFGLNVRPRATRPSKEEIRERVMALLKLVQLDWLADRYPHELSGGQRQRIALARALAVEPKVLLLDEPFGALDTKVRKELRRWLRRLHDELHVTSVFVTHDQDEAMEVSDRVVVMNSGKIEQIGAPDEVYHSPATPFVYQFVGNVNLFHGREREGELCVPAVVKDIFRIGSLVRVELEGDDQNEIQAELTRSAAQHLDLKPGERVFVCPRIMRGFLDGATPGRDAAPPR